MHLNIKLARRQVNGLIWAYERSRIAVVVVGENAEIFANRGPKSNKICLAFKTPQNSKASPRDPKS
jgi:hypothetical protein